MLFFSGAVEWFSLSDFVLLFTVVMALGIYFYLLSEKASLLFEAFLFISFSTVSPCIELLRIFETEVEPTILNLLDLLTLLGNDCYKMTEF